jgi:hypothetical protein
VGFVLSTNIVVINGGRVDASRRKLAEVVNHTIA